MNAEPTIKVADLTRLRNEYEQMARDAESGSRQPGNAGLINRGRVATLRAVAVDLNEIIQGKRHPSGRRR